MKEENTYKSAATSVRKSSPGTPHSLTSPLLGYYYSSSVAGSLFSWIESVSEALRRLERVRKVANRDYLALNQQ